MNTTLVTVGLGSVVLMLLGILVLMMSLHKIGETQVGLVSKHFARKRLKGSNPIAFEGEAGYQAELLMPGWRFKLWPIYTVHKHPWVQIPSGQIGVVLAQIGEKLPVGAKSAAYNDSLGNFSDLGAFLQHGGQKGVQRPVLPPGTLLPLHPVAFIVLTKHRVYGVPVLDEYLKQGSLTIGSFGLQPEQLEVVRIKPVEEVDGSVIDVCGIITTYEGDPLPSGDIASRLGGFEDLAEKEARNAATLELIEALIGTQNKVHNNYQDFQSFLDNGGRIGLQHDPLLYGAYNLNPFLVSVEIVPMLVVEQGQVAVIKAYVGLPTEDTSGEQFQHGAIVKPGHRGIWIEPLRTGKYAINPRCYQPELMPTSILTLNWADAVSRAHTLDRGLSQIKAKSREGFVFKIDLCVQIHVPDTKAAQVISMVGTMENLVSEILQAAVGNHFRDKLQSMPAIRFIEERQQIQVEAMDHITDKLHAYQVQTKGVYIQDVIFPDELVTVLTEREIASQQIETYQRQKEAEERRIDTEAARGRADQQAELARSEVGVAIKSNDADARKAEAQGEAAYIEQTGKAAGAKVRAIGLANAESYERQVAALGQEATATVNVATALAQAGIPVVPEVLVQSGSSLDGLSGVLTKMLHSGPGFSPLGLTVGQTVHGDNEVRAKDLAAEKVEGEAESKVVKGGVKPEVVSGSRDVPSEG